MSLESSISPPRAASWRRIAIRVAIALVATWLIYLAPVPFVDSWWRSANHDTGGLLNVRQRMADWLVLTRDLNGKSSAEVIARLGAPTPQDKFRAQGIVYVLGPQKSLLLTIGKAGTVENAAVIAD
jgi:hypothetical protein